MLSGFVLPVELSARYFVDEPKEVIREALNGYREWRSTILSESNPTSTVKLISKWSGKSEKRLESAKATPLGKVLLTPIGTEGVDCFGYREHDCFRSLSCEEGEESRLYVSTELTNETKSGAKVLSLDKRAVEIEAFTLAELIKIARKFPDTPADLTMCHTTDGPVLKAPIRRLANIKNSDRYKDFEKQLATFNDDLLLINEARANVAFGVSAHTIALNLEAHIAKAEELYG